MYPCGKALRPARGPDDEHRSRSATSCATPCATGPITSSSAKCGGGEAADLLQALNTGHGGSLTTVHANNADSALSCLASCAMQGGGELPWDVTCRGVVDGIALVIHMTRREGRRFVEEAAVVHGYDAGTTTWDIHRLDHVTVQGRVARTGASSPSSPRGKPAGRRRVETPA